MSELTRRHLLASGGVATMGAIAGCMDGSDDGNGDENEAHNGDDENGEPQTASSGTALGGITVENLHEEAHTVDVLVEFDREIEHWTTHELEAGDDGTNLEREWPTESGNFRVTFRIDGEEIRQITSEEWSDRDCLSLMVLILRNGDVKITADTDSAACNQAPEDED